ncbi:MAG: ABC transporter permease, partial [Cytophagales bacterium]|nr:ABC transporter permease [Cytophagales bacterium]
MNHPSPGNPPKWPLRFLRFFLKDEYLEEIEGDLEELFRDNAAQGSLRQARRRYTWEVLKLLRPILLRNLAAVRPLPPLSMYRNYFKITTRGLHKHPLHAFINVFGLAVAIGVCIFLYAFARWTFSTDQFHAHKDSVYLITFFADRDGSVQQFGGTPRPLGERLREDFTHIRKVCRVEDRPVVVKYGDHVFHERVRCTDPEFLDMLTFPLKWGAAGALADVNSIILSEPMAVKYFGEANPVGKTLLVKFAADRGKAFKVGGVARTFPKARTIDFDFLVNFENLGAAEPGYDPADWNAFVGATLIQVDQPANLAAIRRGMNKYKALQNQAAPEDWAIASFSFQPLATLHQRSGDIRDDISRSSGDNYKSVQYLSVIGAVLLALACFNYINIAIATAAKRLKEIGVRKTMGAGRRTIIVQFLAENVVLTSLALVLGLVIGMTVFIPGFEHLWGALDLDFRLTDPVLWLYLPAVLGLTSLASGLYPSLYISGFQVVGILKGSVRFGRNNPLTKVFLGLQLLLACVFITGAVMFTQNSLYLAGRSWGYNPTQTLYATLPDGAAYEKLRARLAQHPDVLSVAGSGHHLGKSHATAVLHLPGRPYEVDQLSVGAPYFETMGLPLVAGRGFRDGFEGEKASV